MRQAQVSRRRRPPQAPRSTPSCRLLALVVLGALALGVLAGTARATPFAAGAFPRMKQANAKIETLAKHFLTVSFGTCQHNRSTMPNCVDAAAQPLFKAFPGVHNVLVTYLGEREHLAVPLDHAEHNRLVGGGPT
jgi:hypothetical protein